jgi:hypothetical protein
MDKIYLKDNYIVTELSGVTAVFPKNYSSYSENASGFYINSTFPVNNQRAVYIDFTRVASVYNEAGTTAYTIATLRSFLLTNTGFKSPSGGSGGVWGSITGTLSSQTDLQSALDAKQDDLVSGTNIKTLEGQSLLGAGNIDLTKSDVGLSNVDNTSDLNKPISTATQTALNAKEDTITAGTTSQYYRGDKTFQTLDKTAVGLGNVDNTSDLNKPISTLTQTALNAKQNTLTLTTTGTSGAATLVGSTLNIPQYTGGGASGIHGFLTPSGMGVTAMVITAATNTATPFANTMYTYPIIMANDYTFNSMQIYCQASLAGGLARILIYSNLNSAPNSKIYESTNIDLSTTGTKTITNTMTFTKGTIYWMVLHFGSGGAPLLIRSMNALSTMPIGYQSNNAPYNLISKSSIPLGSAPTTFGASSVSTINAPLIALFQ